MKRSKLKPFTIAFIILAIVGIPLLLRQGKLGADRSECQMNMRFMYVCIYSEGGMQEISAGQPIPGGIRRLLGLGGYKDLPVCPSGGEYTFVSETTYSHAGVNDNIRCSRAHDLDHVYQDDEREGIMDIHATPHIRKK